MSFLLKDLKKNIFIIMTKYQEKERRKGISFENMEIILLSPVGKKIKTSSNECDHIFSVILNITIF